MSSRKRGGGGKRASSRGKRNNGSDSASSGTLDEFYMELLREAAKERGDDETKVTASDDLDFNGIFKLAEKIETDVQNDIDMLIFCWAGNAESGLSLSKEEFKQAMQYLGATDAKSLKEELGNMKQAILNNESKFRNFFKKAHKLNCEPGAKWIPREVATALLNLIFQWHEHKHLQQFCDFLNSETGKSFEKIKPDEWEQFLSLDNFPVDCQDYDESSAMPIIYDEYADWVKKGKPSKS